MEKLMHYKWLLFDADGTLFDYDKAETSALAKTFAWAGIEFDQSYLPIYRRLNSDLWRQFEQGTIEQKKLKVQRFEELCRDLDIDADPFEMSRAYIGFLGQGTYLIDGAEELIRTLHGQCQMVIITNGLSAVQRPRLANSVLNGYFVDLIISEEVGSAKPDGQIFDHLFQQIGRPPKSEVLIIGDSLSSDITGGIRYGIDTCWFNPERQQRPPDLLIQYEIQRLDQLPPLLEET